MPQQPCECQGEPPDSTRDNKPLPLRQSRETDDGICSVGATAEEKPPGEALEHHLAQDFGSEAGRS